MLTAMEQPVILIADDDLDAVRSIRNALLRRFGPDYRVLITGSASGALEMLEQLAQNGAELALFAAGSRLPQIDGLELLGRVPRSHRGARRALLVDAGDREASELLFRAMAFGQVDFTLMKQSWVSPEEWLYPQVQEALSAWAKTRHPGFQMVRLIGERWSPRCHELRDLLTRNVVPYGFEDVRSAEGQRTLKGLNLTETRLPIAILYDGRVLHDPTNLDVANALGVRTEPDPQLYDVVVVGAGPAGLAAAVYGASEGLRTLVVEVEALGGQAGMSSMIRNYLGFPRGLSGGELTSRAYEQALLFGAQFVFMQRVTGLRVDGPERVISLSAGTEARAKAVVVATGMSYRRLGIPSLDPMLGAGVFYGTGTSEAVALSGQDVCVLGAGNSGGQAAIHLARFVNKVTLLARNDSLAMTMSDYLIKEITATPNIEVCLNTTVVDGRGRSRLEAVTIENLVTRERGELAAAALFILIGSEPRTEWLPDAVLRNESGYILTGTDVPARDGGNARPALPLESSMPGVFAVGDVRAGSVKRVASAVGEGSVAIRFVHTYLAEVAALLV
jgi:thioredoxin reductase (NADPH)